MTLFALRLVYIPKILIYTECPIKSQIANCSNSRLFFYFFFVILRNLIFAPKPYYIASAKRTFVR